MKGDIRKCRRCGKTWSVMAHDDHVEQRGYKYAIPPGEQNSRSFLCPCIYNRMPTSTAPRGKKWKRSFAVEGEVRLFADGGIQVGQEDLDNLIETTFANSLEQEGGGSFKVEGVYRILVQKVALKDEAD